MTLLELSFAVHWPTAGWIGVAIVLTLAVAIAGYEIASEIQRRRRIARRISAFNRHGKLHGQGVKTFSDGSRYEGGIPEWTNARARHRHVPEWNSI